MRTPLSWKYEVMIASVDENAAGDLEVTGALSGNLQPCTMERPTRATRLPWRAAGVENLLDPVTWLAKEATTIGLSESAKTLSSTWPIRPRGRPPCRAPVLVESTQRTGPRPSLAEAREGSAVRDAPVDGQGVHLKSPADENAASIGADHNGHGGVGMEWLTATNSGRRGRRETSRARRPTQSWRMRCFLSLASTKARVSFAAHQRDVSRKAQQVGTLDVILVPKGTTATTSSMRPRSREVGEDETTPG